ncbi:MAG: MBL fold metallo-hydrolase [Woeseiaceae bacterium]|nr:MBL fold metallo-hydrolase [Woeseiaceae bacterium]
MSRADIRHFHHAGSGTLSYVVSDPATRQAAVIDPVLDFNVVSGRTDDAPVRPIIDHLRDNDLKVAWILETHAHADHLSGAQHIKATLGGDVAIGEGIRDVQRHFGDIFNLKPPFRADGHQFDRLFADDDEFPVGELRVRVIATPGHTSDCVTYVVGDAAFVGDTLFMPDAGTARCDFPGGDASRLYDSIRRLFELPPETRLFMCHDYGPDGREIRHVTTVAEQVAANIHVGDGRSREDFVALREKRDATLELPALILPALQVNIRAGNLPPAEDNQVVYLKIPLDRI